MNDHISHSLSTHSPRRHPSPQPPLGPPSLLSVPSLLVICLLTHSSTLPYQPNQISDSSTQPLSHLPIHLFIPLLIHPPMDSSPTHGPICFSTLSYPPTVYPFTHLPTHSLPTCPISSPAQAFITTHPAIFHRPIHLPLHIHPPIDLSSTSHKARLLMLDMFGYLMHVCVD